MVERKVFEEIKLCTYRDVEGVFDKYFEEKEKDWTCRAFDIYKNMKDWYVGGEWTNLPDPPIQAKVLETGGSDSRMNSSRKSEAATT